MVARHCFLRFILWTLCLRQIYTSGGWVWLSVVSGKRVLGLYLEEVTKLSRWFKPESGGGGGTPYDGLYGEAPPERGIFFRPQVYERVGISLVEVYKRVGKSVTWICEGAQKGWRMNFMAL